MILKTGNFYDIMFDIIFFMQLFKPSLKPEFPNLSALRTGREGRGDSSMREGDKRTPASSSICTSGRHVHSPLMLMEHMCSPAIRTSEDVHVCSPSTSMTQFERAQGLVVGHGLMVEDPCLKPFKPALNSKLICSVNILVFSAKFTYYYFT